MTTLFDLHKKYDSLKARDKYKHIHHFTKKVYPCFFDSRKNDKLKVLELGVYKGGSLKAMRDYLPNATLYGIDIDIAQAGDLGDRIQLIEGNQSSKSFLISVGNNFGPFDFIIDDAGHDPFSQVISYESLWSFVNKKGTYFIEDLDIERKGYVFMSYIKDNKVTSQTFMVDEDSTIESISFYFNLISISKK